MMLKTIEQMFHVLESRIQALFQQCSQLKAAIHFYRAKPKSTNIQISINNMQSSGVKIALTRQRIKQDLSKNKHRAHVGLDCPLPPCPAS